MNRVLTVTAGSIAFVFSSLAQSKELPAKPAHLITEEAARKVAVKEYNGKVLSDELEYEGGRWVYSYDIADISHNGSVHEIQVDAASGKVVSKTIESAKDEAKEKEAESRAK